MLKRIALGIAIVSLCAAQASFAGDEPHDCMAQSVSGQSLQKSAGGTWGPIQPGPLALGTVVRTGVDAGLTLAFENGNLFRVAPNSELVVGESDSAEVLLHEGLVMAHVTSPAEVHTATSSTKADSGEFIVSANVDGASLRVLEGKAVMKGLDGATSEYPYAGEIPAGVNPAPLALAYAATEQRASATEATPQTSGTGSGTESTKGAQDSKTPKKKGQPISSQSSGTSLLPTLGGLIGAGLLGLLVDEDSGGVDAPFVSGETMSGSVTRDTDAAIYSPNDILRLDACCSGHS